MRTTTHPTTVRARPYRLAAAFLATLGVFIGIGITGTPAMAVDDLGATVTKTDVGPTGYSVTFRYAAPADVQSVQIFGEWLFSQPENILSTTQSDLRFGSDWKAGDTIAGYNNGWLTQQMSKGDDGIWTFTTPLPSGTFSYGFLHDCASSSGANCTRYADPTDTPWNTGIVGAGAQNLSQIYVPENSAFPTYDNAYQAPTETGQLLDLAYPSPTTTDPSRQRRVAVYLPQGYDATRAVPYPTVYISHGAGGNEADWTTQGIAHYIEENAVDDGAAQSFVIVATDFNGLATTGGNNIPASQVYADDVKSNVIPFIESSFNVSKLASDRAMAGLSAGGNRALVMLYDNTASFEYFAAWSPPAQLVPPAGYGTPDDAQLARLNQIKGGIHLGTGLQDWLGGNNAIRNLSTSRAAALVAAGVNLVENDIDGIHSWDVWRQEFNDFVRTSLFRTTTVELSAVTHLDNPGKSIIRANVVPVTGNVTAPTGQVIFYAGDSGAELGSAEISSTGMATLTVADAPLGSSVSAVYQGDDLFNGTESAISVTAADPTIVAPTEDALTDAMQGGVTIDGPVHPGETVTVHVDSTLVAVGLRGWLFPGSTDLGTASVDEAGVIQFVIPRSAAVGEYRLALALADGTVIGWGNLQLVAAASGGGSGGDGTGSDAVELKPAANSGNTLAATGVDVSGFTTLAGGLLVGGVVLMGAFRRRNLARQ